MGRSFKLLALVLGAFVLATALPAEAAAPATGSLSSKKKMITFNGGPFNVSFPLAGCIVATDSSCDPYDLKVLMGDGAKFKVSIVGSAGPLDAANGNDFDLYVFAPDGTLAGSSESLGGKEAVIITHKSRHRGKPYAVRVVPFLVVPGATYKGTAAITKFVK